MKIILKKDFSFVYLNKNIYTNESIFKVISIFEEFVSISFNELGKYFALKIESNNKDYLLKEITFEFINYLNGVEYEVLRENGL